MYTSFVLKVWLNINAFYKYRYFVISPRTQERESSNVLIKTYITGQFKYRYFFYFFRRWSKACMLLTCILGLTWLFGVFYINQDSLFMAYCFTIFNTLQVNHYHLSFSSRYQRPVANCCSYNCKSKPGQPSKMPSLQFD